MTVTIQKVRERFVDIGYDCGVREIDKLIKAEKNIEERFNRYCKRVIQFAEKFGAFSINHSYDTYTLRFLEHCREDRELADNLKLPYYEQYDEDGHESEAHITFPKTYFNDIMHLYTNSYQNQCDIYQSKLPVR